MSREQDGTKATAKAPTYRIRLEGQLTGRWAEWFDGMSIATRGDQTILVGPVVDQAALHGLLRKVRDLGMPLVEVLRLDDDTAESAGRRPS